jgi:hypothetical protein
VLAPLKWTIDDLTSQSSRSIVMPNKNSHWLVRNLNGTSKNKCWCNSWIAHWVSVSGVNYPICAKFGCTRPGEVGAHVQIIDGRTYRDWYIVPLCKGHNHFSNTEPMFIKRSVELVQASVAQTCGQANWWT